MRANWAGHLQPRTEPRNEYHQSRCESMKKTKQRRRWSPREQTPASWRWINADGKLQEERNSRIYGTRQGILSLHQSQHMPEKWKSVWTNWRRAEKKRKTELGRQVAAARTLGLPIHGKIRRVRVLWRLRCQQESFHNKRAPRNSNGNRKAWPDRRQWQRSSLSQSQSEMEPRMSEEGDGRKPRLSNQR